MQKPHAEYAYVPIAYASASAIGDYTYPHRHLPFATFLTEIEIYQISMSQERAPW